MELDEMEHGLLEYVELLIKRYPILSVCRKDIITGYKLMEHSYRQGGKLLIAGNGGSAADAEHITGELMKKFKIPRPVSREFAEKLKKENAAIGKQLAESLECGLMAIPLVTHEALFTAYMNDADGECVYAQQLFGYGRKGDVFLGISTSGNSQNVVNAAIVANAMGIHVIGLTGDEGGILSQIADVTVRVPEMETYIIQELHMPVYHCWCMMLEKKFFGME